VDLINNAKTCEFGTLQDSALIEDIIVCGIRDKDLRQRSLRDTKLTLPRAKNTARAAELDK
jgi:hypothetical protein